MAGRQRKTATPAKKSARAKAQATAPISHATMLHGASIPLKCPNCGHEIMLHAMVGGGAGIPVRTHGGGSSGWDDEFVAGGAGIPVRTHKGKKP